MYNAISAATSVKSNPAPAKGSSIQKKDSGDFKDLVKDKINSPDTPKDNDKNTEVKDDKVSDSQKPEDSKKQADEKSAEDVVAAMLYSGKVNLSDDIELPKVKTSIIDGKIQELTVTVQKETNANDAENVSNKLQNNISTLQEAANALKDVQENSANVKMPEVIEKKIVVPETKLKTNEIKEDLNLIDKEISTKAVQEVVKPLETEAKQPIKAESKNVSEEAAKTVKTLETQNQPVKENEKTNDTAIPMPKEEIKYDYHKVAIKVGDGAGVKSQDLVNELADKIVYNTNGKADEFDIQLFPKDLGKLNIKVVFENGKAELSIICSNAKTFNLLSENVSGLCAIVKENTGNSTVVNIQQNKEFFNEQQKDGYDDRGQNSQRDEQNNQQNNRSQNKDDMIDFVNQMRLGLAGNWNSI